MRRDWVPHKTGNLANNAIYYYVQGDKFVVQVSDYTAPYVPYTNEPWISPKWNGKKNPNQWWWQKFADEFARRLANALKGELKK